MKSNEYDQQNNLSPLPPGIAGGDGREGNAWNRVVEALSRLPLGKLRVDVVEGEGVDQTALLALPEEGDEVTGRGTGDSHWENHNGFPELSHPEWLAGDGWIYFFLRFWGAITVSTIGDSCVDSTKGFFPNDER